MRFGAVLAVFLFLASSCLALQPDFAEAARMGGGKSFGSRPYMSQPAPAPRQFSQPSQPMRDSGFAGAQRSASPGMGALGGLAGGLLAGSLLGSLFGGSGGMGGTGGFGFMDILLLGALAYFAYRLFQRSRARQQSAPAASAPYGAPSPFDGPVLRNDSSPAGWGAAGSGFAGAPQAAQGRVDIPAGFDVDEFLRGAKMAYNRMQKSWDQRNLSDIAQFASPAVMEELRSQMAADPKPGNTEILLLNAQIAGVEDDGPRQRAQVYFDALLRESPDQAAPASAREIWHFIREGRDGMWKLDGIQQVE